MLICLVRNGSIIEDDSEEAEIEAEIEASL
jgi:hypothetical protein